MKNTKMKNFLLSVFKLYLFATITVGIISGKSFASTGAAETPIPLNPKLIEGKLPNGLRYLILKNSKPEKKVELRLAVNAGSILEDDDQQGLAHLMEHMNFNGLKHFPHNEVVHYLQSIGVGFGADLNAYTSFDETVYMLPVPSDNKDKVDSAFTILADWSGNALLDDKEIDNERPVVLEESRMGKGAEDRMFQKWFPKVMNGSKYGARFPIGKDSILKTFPYAAVKRFYKDWYRPDLQCVVVVGDIDPKVAEHLIKEKFSGFKNPEHERVRPSNFNLSSRKNNVSIVTSDPEAAYTSLTIVGNSKIKKADLLPSEYRATLITNMYTQLLNQRYAELTKQANPPFIYGGGSVNNNYFRGWSCFGLSASCAADKVKAAIQALLMETNRAKKYGFTKEEFERIKASMLASYEQSFAEREKTESRQLVDELVRHFLEEESVPGIAWEYAFTKKCLPGITLEELNRIGEKFDFENYYSIVLTSKPSSDLPTEATLQQWATEALGMEVKPYTEKTLPTHLLEKEPVAGRIVKETTNTKIGVTTYLLSNGATVTLKQTNFKNDEIVFAGVRKGGSSLYQGEDFQSSMEASEIVEQMGFGQFSATDLTKFLAGKHVNCNIRINNYVEKINGSSSRKDLTTAFQLLYLKTTSPKEDEEVFKGFITKQIQVTENLSRDPQNVFFDSLFTLKSNGNPREKNIHPASYYNQINWKHALDFYRTRVNNAFGMHYYFVGNFKEGELKPLIEKYIASIQSAPMDTVPKDLNFNPLNGNQSLTLKKGVEDKSIVYNIIYGRSSCDGNESAKAYILGEILDNEITDTIRESMGAIYSGSFGIALDPLPSPNYSVYAYLPCGSVNATKVSTVFWRMLEESKKPGGITKAALTKAQKTAIEQYKVNIKSNNYWLNVLSTTPMNGFNPERILTYKERVNALTPEEMTDLANKYFQLDNVFKSLLLPEK